MNQEDKWRLHIRAAITTPEEYEAKKVQEYIAKIRQWLRYHNDYSVNVELFSVFGTIQVTVWRGDVCVETSRGETLSKHLSKCFYSMLGHCISNKTGDVMKGL